MNVIPSILVVDDDANLLDALTIYLGKRAWRVVAASNGQEAQEAFGQQPADLVVLDIMLPDMDGWELCQWLRQITDVPIIMLTARGQDYDRIKGLRLGADDYLVKPFSLRELETRIAALLQRGEQFAAEEIETYYDDGTLLIDGRQRQVSRQGIPVRLTSTERRLLFLLAEQPNQTLPAEHILHAIWGPQYPEQRDYVEICIWRLRQKIEPYPEEPRYLVSEPGNCYRFTWQVDG